MLRAVLYMVAQCLGACTGAGLVRAVRVNPTPRCTPHIAPVQHLDSDKCFLSRCIFESAQRSLAWQPFFLALPLALP